MSNVPKLRFKEFSENYKKYKFEDIFSFSTGKNIKQNEASPDFDIPCVRYGELYHMYSEVINKVINKTNLDKSELTFSQGNEILLPSAGEDPLDIGSASALKIANVAIGRTINILRPLSDNTYLPEYVSYLINTKLKKKISTLAKGVSISNVYNSDLKTLTLSLPSKQEQEKIALFFTSVDTKIEQLIKKEELLQQYKKGVMQKIFKQEIRFKANDGSEFCDWEEKKLGEYIKQKSTKNKDKIVNLVLSVSNKKGFITQEEQFDGYEVASKDISGYKIVEKSDYAYNPSRINVGSIARLKNFDVGIVSPMYVVFCLKKELNPIFFDNLYQTHKFKYLIKIGCSGSVRDSLNFEDLSSFKVKIPCIEEQIKIANFLSSIDFKIEQVQKQLNFTKEFKKALLQQMFV
ncbi:restriction endonuclease subunit S [Aliarcobacter skirrowii]|uniref:restriction endonuclease subunit S n=1 Tax=Aliarcobacter skirrowii TaxID=28200 RepID=UPI0029AFBB6B|nr:restriction endonuclease subunit S [Aliarcobacter skirrowii]MDX3960254.1 restriction endonuclease subunit S [Aliarcobacter skirrowii]